MISHAFCPVQLVDSKGFQHEVPDTWLTQGNPWEVARHDIKHMVRHPLGIEPVMQAVK